LLLVQKHRNFRNAPKLSNFHANGGAMSSFGAAPDIARTDEGRGAWALQDRHAHIAREDQDPPSLPKGAITSFYTVNMRRFEPDCGRRVWSEQGRFPKFS
jgi:hypothetical protein